MEYQHSSREALIAGRHAKYPAWQEEDVQAWADAKLHVSAEAFAVFAPATWTALDWPTVLGGITCPVLLIVTDPETGGILTPETTASFQRLVPHAQIAYIPRASHNIRRDQCARFIAEVQAFLVGLPG